MMEPLSAGLVLQQARALIESGGWLDHLDGAAIEWLNGFVGTLPPFDALVRILVSDYFTFVVSSLVLLGLWFGARTPEARASQQRAVLAGALALLIANGIVMYLNGLYFRPRPFVDHDLALLFYRPTDSSFPANSAAVAFSMATAAAAGNLKVGAWLLVAAGLLGFSRVYAGVHYPTDVVAGALIGVVAGVLALAVLRLLEPLVDRLIHVARLLHLA